jgi:hypothetical protein
MTPLHEHIVELIKLEGPISLERFMGMALGDPRYGYYMTRDPLGAQGDFTTSPEISQMFGELIGLWCADLWLRMGQPEKLSLVELGPGRGTLMQDVLRATKNVIGLHRALTVTLVEMSPVLREKQRQTLAPSGVTVQWNADISALPELPTILLANEFFDALPVRHYQNFQGQWHQRLIGLGPDDKLMFGLARESERALTTQAPDGSVFEFGLIGETIMADLAAHLAQFGGAGLVIDYGHTQSGFGETLQAMKGHSFVDPLTSPGEVDITTHVNFERFGRIVQSQGAVLAGPTTQAQFLDALGIVERAARLIKGADAAQGQEIEAALVRLTEQSATGMGRLFKVLGLHHPDTPEPAGFK